MADSDATTGKKLGSLKRVIRYRPRFAVAIILFSLFATLLEGIGLTFLVPIIEAAQAGGNAPPEASGIAGVFLQGYDVLGLPFTLDFLIVGLAAVMVVRYTASFVAKWFAAKLTMGYERHLKTRAYSLALGATVPYFDEKGSDEILNTIITETRYAGQVIQRIISLFQQVLLSVTYAAIALYIAPVLTVLSAVALGGVTFLLRYVIEPGYTVGDRVADANERLQENVQAGTQGIREVKLFGMAAHLHQEFERIVDGYTTSSVDLRRNQIAVNSAYQLSLALVLFCLIYVAVGYRALPISSLGVFLFAMFRLAPRISRVSSTLYTIEGQLPHLIRTHEFIDRLSDTQERVDGTSPPDRIETIEFDDVTFAYGGDEPVIRNVSFEVGKGDFVGVVGHSGAGKSTIVALLARMYQPGEGEIRVNGTPISSFDQRDWREQVAMVRQDPYIFDDTLSYNLTMGVDVPRETLQEVADAAQVTEFLDGLPDGFDTVLGDDGVKLSGGQRQRVALARALLTDAEVLLLDEATSDLDSDLERKIHDTIHTLGGDRTILAIAHRLSTVAGADRIYTVEDGRITETGSHSDLLDGDGTYAELYALQSAGTEQVH